MKTSLSKCVALFTALFSLPAIEARAGETAPPNVVVVLVDDMGWSDIGCYGGEIPTPHIDALARDGLRYTQFYNTARCSPTRAALLTGLYPHQAGMGYLEGMANPESRGTHGRLAERAVTVAEVLGDAGYFTAMAGKWHLGQNRGPPPWKRGFQRVLNSSAGGIYFPDQKGNHGGKKLFLDGKPLDLGDPLFGETWYSTQPLHRPEPSSLPTKETRGLATAAGSLSRSTSAGGNSMILLPTGPNNTTSRRNVPRTSRNCPPSGRHGRRPALWMRGPVARAEWGSPVNPDENARR